MNKLKILDLFSGCGGLSLGFKMAGYQIIGAIDKDKDSIETFKKNFKKGIFLNEDINFFKNKDINTFFKKIDIIIGGPPCQGFSSANRWQKNYKDPRNLLFLKFIDFVKNIKPKLVLIENVRGILSKSNGKIIHNIKKILSNMGYYVNCELLDASDYGVPQVRKRIFIVANRINKLNFVNFLRKKEKVTVGEALIELYNFEKKNKELHLNGKFSNNYIKYLRRKNSKVYNHEIIYPASSTIEKIKYVKQGENWKKIPKKLDQRDLLEQDFPDICVQDTQMK